MEPPNIGAESEETIGSASGIRKVGRGLGQGIWGQQNALWGVHGCQTFGLIAQGNCLRRANTAAGGAGAWLAGRQVAEAVGSSSHLTPRWRKVDSNFRF